MRINVLKITCLVFFTTLLINNATGKIFTKCELVAELEKQNVPSNLIPDWVCLIKSESGGTTTLVTGPKTDSTYSYGIFQINSSKWCTRGRTGGVCNKRCEDFSNDDIGDDIRCASLIYDREGFEGWNGWTKRCEGKTLPDLSRC